MASAALSLGFLRQRHHRAAHLVAARRAHLGEIGARGVGHLHREIRDRGSCHERVGQFVDRVVADRNRAVAAGIGGLEPVILRRLLADLDGLHHQLAMAVGAPAAAFIQREGRGNQFAAGSWPANRRR